MDSNVVLGGELFILQAHANLKVEIGTLFINKLAYVSGRWPV